MFQQTKAVIVLARQPLSSIRVLAHSVVARGAVLSNENGQPKMLGGVGQGGNRTEQVVNGSGRTSQNSPALSFHK